MTYLASIRQTKHLRTKWLAAISAADLSGLKAELAGCSGSANLNSNIVTIIRLAANAGFIPEPRPS